jgi:hypothetical protein
MDQYEKNETRKKLLNTSIPDIDQLCNLIDENTFGLKSFSSSKIHSVPSYQIKAFHSSRLKRLHSSSTIKSNVNENENTSDRTFSILLNRFRSLSTSNLPQSRRYSSSTINFFHQKSNLSSNNDEEMNSSSTTQSQLSCTIVDTRETTANSCNVAELAAYFDDFLYLPKSLSGAAELMYT